MKILIINGPNLNLLGKREPEIYGTESFEAFLGVLSNKYKDVDLDYFQDNSEGSIIDALHQADEQKYDGIVLNAGAYTHYSIAILDAVKAITVPVVEVHISQPAAREEFRHRSVIAAACIGSISGFGFNSYTLAIEALLLK